MKTGIMGGTFNPIHNAHLEIARELLQQCRLDRVIFIPAALPPHKDDSNLAPFEQRLEMVRLAISQNPRFEVSTIEQQRPGKSYSVDTLDQLHKLYPQDQFYFLIGMDSFTSIDSWHHYPRLFELCNLVIARRPGTCHDDARPELPVAIDKHFCYDAKLNMFCHESGQRLIFLKDTFLDISSTQIRARIAAHQTVDTLLPAAVAEYIYAHGLYVQQER